jgi:hypothetical protein
MFGGPTIGKMYAKLNRRVQDQRSDRVEAMRDRAGQVDDEAPGEKLACPECKETYEYGYECPTCGVPLDGESVVASGANKPRFQLSSTAVVGIIFGLIALFCAGWTGLAYMFPAQ